MYSGFARSLTTCRNYVIDVLFAVLIYYPHNLNTIGLFFRCNAQCRKAEVYRKGTQGSVLAWRAASFLFRRLLLLYWTSVVTEEGRVGCRVSLWEDDSRISTLLALSRHFSARRRNTRVPYSCNVPLVLGYEKLTGLSYRTRGLYTDTEYPIKYCVLEIPSNIIYHITYSYDYSAFLAGYPSFHIAYLIYSTSH